jgi:hypothetical protein
MSPILLAYLILIVLHNVDGEEISINVEQIVVLKHTKESTGGTNALIAGGHKCVVGLTNGKFIGVVEDCGTVRQAIRQAQKMS